MAGSHQRDDDLRTSPDSNVRERFFFLLFIVQTVLLKVFQLFYVPYTVNNTVSINKY